jgi:hypothetical protein
MKKFISIFLFTIFTCNLITATTQTNKTYLSTRPVLQNKAMEFSVWHTLLFKSSADSQNIIKKTNKEWVGTIQATAFYQESNNEYNLGQYFGYHDVVANEIRDFVSVVTNENSDGIWSAYLTHDYAGGHTVPIGDVGFSPRTYAYGVRLDWHQEFKRFFVRVNTAVVQAKTNLGYGGRGTLVSSDKTGISGKNLIDFFTGNLEQTTQYDQQEKLTYAKFAGSKNNSGLADVDVYFGYNMFEREDVHLDFGIFATIPTGNESKGEFLFEPIYGNGDHFAFGGFFDSKVRIWDDERDSIELLFSANLKYLFENTQKRTVGIKDDNLDYIPYGHYYLGGQSGKTALFPLANVLTQDLKIEPGVHFEGLVALLLRAGNFTFDIGYNLFVADKENVKLKHAWVDDTYAIANPACRTDAAFDLDGTDGQNPAQPYADQKIQSQHIDLAPATTPTRLTNKVYAAFGYAFSKCQVPFMLGCGASYECTVRNTALEGYALWTKLAVLF